MQPDNCKVVLPDLANMHGTEAAYSSLLLTRKQIMLPAGVKQCLMSVKIVVMVQARSEPITDLSLPSIGLVQVHYQLTPGDVQQIFAEKPHVQRAFAANVPAVMGEKAFWQRFFKNEYSRQVRCLPTTHVVMTYPIRHVWAEALDNIMCPVAEHKLLLMGKKGFVYSMFEHDQYGVERF